MIAFGEDRGRGMLLGVEPSLDPSRYRSVDSFATGLAVPLEEARAAGWLGPKTIAVYGEYVGTWLVALGEGDAAIRADSIAVASRRMALRHLPRFALALAGSRASDRATEAIFRLKAADMAAGYQEAFGRLARRFGITIVAGSIVLPRPARTVRAPHVRPGSARERERGLPSRRVAARPYRAQVLPHGAGTALPRRGRRRGPAGVRDTGRQARRAGVR